MLNHITLIICCALSVELFIYSNFRLIVFSLVAVLQKAIKIISSENISDCWKEKAVPLYALSMFKYSIKSFFIILLIIIIFYLPTFLLNDFIHQSISMLGIIESIVFCIAYLKIRKIVF